MCKIFMIVCLAATVTFARAADTVQVSGVIGGKPLQVVPEVRQKLVEESISLLASCAYSSLHDSSTNTLHFADAEKQSHLTFIFAKPPTVEVKTENMKVDVKKMVITLPLSSGVVWVSSNHSTSYFAKFTPEASFKLEATLKAAQNQ